MDARAYFIYITSGLVFRSLVLKKGLGLGELDVTGSLGHSWASLWPHKALLPCDGTSAHIFRRLEGTGWRQGAQAVLNVHSSVDSLFRWH